MVPEVDAKLFERKIKPFVDLLLKEWDENRKQDIETFISYKKLNNYAKHYPKTVLELLVELFESVH